jgi:hypothetical protein
MDRSLVKKQELLKTGSCMEENAFAIRRILHRFVSLPQESNGGAAL